MSSNYLSLDSLPDFLNALTAFGDVHGPILTGDGVSAFGPVTTVTNLHLDYHRTLIPPKKYLLHPRETILTFTPDDGYGEPSVTLPETVLIGIHPCDLQGIAYLDRVFMDDANDPLYLARRSALTLIGLSCEPDEFCFCGNLSAAETDCCDMMMLRSAGGFHLSGATPKGMAIIDNLTHILAEAEPPPAIAWSCEHAEILRKASGRGEKFERSPLWDVFADNCLSCGACSLCCPTCYCFDIREYGSLDGETAVRLREWDNCLFRAHGEVAGGFNFRKSRRERFHYRFQHKYLGFGPLRGVVSCVGCGRCREVCPVGIDLQELFREGDDDSQR
jgi:sulfhydrogenase subunit beta (sulfur reductase)